MGVTSGGRAVEGEGQFQLPKKLRVERPSAKSSAVGLKCAVRSSNDVRSITESTVGSMKLKWILGVSFLLFGVFGDRSAGEIGTPAAGGEPSHEAWACLTQQEISLVPFEKEQGTNISNSAISSEASKLPEIYYRPGSAVPTTEGRQNLVRVVEWLQHHPKARVVIVGYTDGRGRKVANQILGLRRARAVETFLCGKGHLARNQIVGVESFGDSKPVCLADTEDCLARNRRVRIEVVGESKLSD